MNEPACQTTDPELWFDLKNEGSVRLAKKLCGTCDISIACLENCLEFETMSASSRYGIFGGLTPEERTNLTYRKRPA